MSHDLTDPEVRVLGCLLEKQRMTPDAYPLTLNALRAACNQSTNRDPVVQYDEATIRDALDRLGRRRFTRLTSYHGSRTAKFRHLLDEALAIGVEEQAVLAVLMLRGPQTPGELHQRTERLHRFPDAEALTAVIDGLIERELVTRFERRPGQREERYGHLLGDEAGERLGGKVRDVSELLAEAGPRPGTPLDLDVAYDAPCHLQHAQRVHAAPLAVLGAIPGLRIQLLPGHDRCCGSAGIYSVLKPAMARAVLADKIEAIAAAYPRPAVLATGNPGCMMQIGAGLLEAGLDIPVAHPVELLDRSYALQDAPYGTGAAHVSPDSLLSLR